MSDPISINLLLGAITEPAGTSCPGAFDPGPLLIQFGGVDNAWTSFTAEEENVWVYDSAVDGLGNIIVAAEVTSTSVSIAQAWISKFSSSGDLLWRKHFNRTGAEANGCGAMAVTTDDLGNVYVGGYHRLNVATPTAHREDYPFFVKFDCQGNEVWSQAFASDGPYTSNYSFFVEAMTFHEGFVYALAVENYETTYLVKLSPAGSMVFKKAIKAGTQADSLYGFGLQADGNGDLLIGGSNWGMDRLYFAKFDTNGNNIWFRATSYGDGLYEYENGFAVAPNGSVAISTVGGNDEVGVVIYDTDGNLVVNKLVNFGQYVYSPQYHRCAFNASNELIVGGVLIGYTSTQNHYFKVNTSGNIAWERVLVSGTNQYVDDISPSQMIIKDGLIYIAHSSMSNGYNRHEYTGILKMPAEPSGNGRFGDYISYHTPLEKPYMATMVAGTFADIANAATTYGFNFDASEPLTLVGGYSIVEHDKTAEGISTVLLYQNYPTLTNDSWSAMWTQNEWPDANWHYAGFQHTASDASGNIYCCGYYDDPGSFSRNAMVKFSPSGTVIWQKYLQLTAGFSREMYLDVDSSGNLYQLIKTTTNLWHLVKWDSDGTVLWQRALTITGSAIYRVKATTSGVYCLGNGAPPNGIVFKYGHDGTLIYQKNFTLTTPNGATAEVDVTDIQEVSDGIVVSGEVLYSSTAGWNIFIAKLSSDFTTVTWSHIYGLDSVRKSLDTAYAMLKDSSDNFYLVGGNNDGAGLDANAYRMAIIKFNSSGTKLWERKWHAPGGIAMTQFNGGLTAAMSSDEHIYIGAYTLIPSFGDNYARDGTHVLSKFNLNGDRLWSKEIYPGGGVQTNMVGLGFRGDRAFFNAEYVGDRYGGWLANMHVTDIQNGAFGRWFVRDFALLTESDILATEVTGPVNNPTTSTYTVTTPTATTANVPSLMQAFVQPIR